MTVDYPGAKDMSLPINYSFDTITPLKIIIHKTAGNTDLNSLYNTFYQTMRSTHYGIDLDGSIAQFVPENRGAGGNCCVDPAPYHSTFWDPLVAQFGNLNLCTLSVEHIDPTSDNSYVMPQAQIDTSHKLVKYWCDKYHLAWLDVHSHASINMQNKARCPGPTYDFNALFAYLQGDQQVQELSETDILNLFNSIIPNGRFTSGLGNEWHRRMQANQWIGPPTQLETSITWKGIANTPCLYCTNGFLTWEQAVAYWHPYQ